MNEPPILFFQDASDWENWLKDHTDQHVGVWLKFAKKTSGIVSLTYAPALEVALCYGWIDGLARSIDEQFYMQKFTPRRPKSIWSKRNISITERLIADGRMQPAGMEAINAARADGRWEQAYDSPSNSTVPDDFAAELAKNPAAAEFFESLNKANRYAFLWRIQTAKRAETRQKRIAQFIDMLTRGEKFH